jgi:hypothetical protein
MAKLAYSDHALLLTTVQHIFTQTNYDELSATMIALLQAAIPCEVIAFKHKERIFLKLDVENRQAAMLKILQATR